MKQSYTTFAPYLWALAKWARTTPEHLFELTFPSHSTVRPEHQTECVSMLLQLCVIQGKATHLFLPGREFCDWITSCVPQLEAAHADIVREEIAVAYADCGIGVFHFPTQSHLRSIAFLIPSKVDFRRLGFGSVNSGCVYFSYSKEGPIKNKGRCSCVGLMPGIDTGCDAESIWCAKLIVGLGMYINCFPEVLRAGLPDALKHPSHHQYKHPVVISVSPKVAIAAPGTHASPAPHFRIGHFRVLTSERFTNKRHQVVFVRETFVKGRTATVLSPEETVVTATK